MLSGLTIPIVVVMLATFLHLPSRNTAQFLLPLSSVPYTFVGRTETIFSATQVVHILGPYAFGKATLATTVMRNEGVDIVFIKIRGHSIFDSISKDTIEWSTNSKESPIRCMLSQRSLTLVVSVECDEWLETNNGNLEEL